MKRTIWFERKEKSEPELKTWVWTSLKRQRSSCSSSSSSRHWGKVQRTVHCAERQWESTTTTESEGSWGAVEGKSRKAGWAPIVQDIGPAFQTWFPFFQHSISWLCENAVRVTWWASFSPTERWGQECWEEVRVTQRVTQGMRASPVSQSSPISAKIYYNLPASFPGSKILKWNDHAGMS